MQTTIAVLLVKDITQRGDFAIENLESPQRVKIKKRKAMRTLLTLTLALCCSLHQSNADAQSNAADYILAMQAREIEREARMNGAKRIGQKPRIAKIGRLMDAKRLVNNEVGRFDAIFVVGQVIPDRKQVLLQYGTMATIMLLDFDNKQGLLDKQDLVIDGLVQVGEPLTYQTAKGSNTVATIRLVEGELLKKLEPDLIKKYEAAKQAELEAEYPEWTSRTGSKVRAKFIRYVATQVELETIDGKTIRVKLTDFAKPDAARLRRIIKEAKENSR